MTVFETWIGHIAVELGPIRLSLGLTGGRICLQIRFVHCYYPR